MSTACATCDEIEAAGYSPVAHCDGCHITWGGHAEVHCGQCHRHFSGDTAFMAHRRDSVCRDPSSLKDGEGNPRFVPVQKRSRFGSRTVWVRAKEFDASAFQNESKTVSVNLAPTEHASPARA